MRLYGLAHPSRATRVAWALEEAGADWTYEAVGLQDPAFLALNPIGKVPCLVDGDLVLTESAACCTYVGTRYPDAGLVPTAPADRARYDRWCSFVVTELEQPLWTKSKHRFALPAHLRAPEVLPAARWEWDRASRALEAGLGERTFLVGDRFTCADLLAAHTVHWARVAKFPVSERLAAYADPLLARPALARAMAAAR